MAANDRSNTQCFECNAPDVVFENFGDEMILLNLQSGRYFSLSPTGTYYWECISQGVPDAEAVARMAAAYPDASVALDLEALLGDFIAESLVRRSQNARAISDVTITAQLPAEYVRPEMARYTDLQEMLLLDPVHDVGEAGWPEPAPAPPVSRRS